MKLLTTMVFALTAFTAAAQNKPMTDSYKLDTDNSVVKWEAYKKLGAGHHGTVKAKTGTLSFDGDVITGGEIVADMNTIAVADIPASDEANGKLTGHLKAPDFFDVSKYPEAKLVIKSSEKSGKNLKVKGDLTFIGKTNPVEFIAAVTKAGNTVTAKSDIMIDRTKWGLKYNSGNYFKDLAGDRIIKDEFKLAVELKATK